MRLVRASKLLRRELGPVIGLSVILVPVGLVFLPCLLGLPVLAFAFGQLVRVTLTAARAERGERPLEAPKTRAAGIVALVGLGLLAAAMIAGASVAAEVLGESRGLVAVTAMLVSALVASVAVGAALVPFALAPFALVEGAAPAAALTRSFELAARLGPRRLVALGALAGAWMGAWTLAAIALFVASAPDAAITSAALAAPFGLIPGPPVVAALLADAYVECSANAAAQLGRNTRVSGKVRGLGLVVAPAMAIVIAAMTIAALTPLPMRSVAMEVPVRRGLHGVGLTEGPHERALPGGHAVVRTTAHGVSIDANDGGGAGAVDAGFDTRTSWLDVVDGRLHGGATGTFAVIVVGEGGSAFTIVDAEGVRHDDGLHARVIGRLGGIGAIALFVALGLSLQLAFRLGVGIGEARVLEAPDLRDGARARAGLAALEGTLRLGEGARIRMPSGLARRAGAPLSVEGPAWVEADAGALRFRLPEGRVATLSGAGVEPRDGSAVVLLSRFSSVSPVGHREAGSAWPEDGRLVLGTRGDAAEALVRRASADASWLALAILIGLATASTALLSAL